LCLKYTVPVLFIEVDKSLACSLFRDEFRLEE
jgi:hypothetical protein